MKLMECVRERDRREGWDWCSAVWICAGEGSCGCSLRGAADAGEVWV